MDKIVNIQTLDPNSLDYQIYSPEDQNLVSNFNTEIFFDPSLDTIEYIVYDLNKSILSYNPFYPKFSLINDRISIDPQNNLEEEGFTEGQYITKYNFISNLLDSSFVSKFYIQEISSDRTEIRLNTTQISNDALVFEANKLINDTIQKKLDLNRTIFPTSLKKFGNTSSATIPLTITLEAKENSFSGLSVISGFGVGLSVSNAIINFENVYISNLVEC
jgi:hypothetical protein